MANELVKYDNDLNDVSFIGFTNINYDIFMGIVSRMRDKGEQELSFPFADLRRLCNIEYKMSNDEFWKMLKDMAVKLNNLKIRFETDTEFELFTLFPTFRAYKEKQILKVKINSDFAYMLNNFTEFTQFELSQFTRLKSKYSRTLFRKLKQFRNTGHYDVALDEFRRLFDIPKGYTTKDIKEKIIKPCKEELACYFPDLDVNVHRLPKRGAPVGGYTFRFTGKGQVKGQISLADYAMPEKQKEGYKRKKKAEEAEKTKKTHGFPERENVDYDDIQKKLSQH